MSFFDDMFSAASEWFSGDGASSVESVASSILDGAQLVGSILAVAGAITGDSKLMKIGAGVSIGATAISAFSNLPSFSSSEEAMQANGATEAGSDATGASSTDLSSTDGMPSGSKDEPMKSGGLIGSSLAGPMPLQEAQTQPAAKEFAQQNMAAPQAPKASSEVPVSAGSAGGAEAIRLRDSELGGSTSIATQAAKKLESPGRGLIGGMLGFSRDNPELMKIGAGLISGAVQGYQQDAVRRDNQRRYEDDLRKLDEQRARYNRSILDQNLNRP